MNAQAFMEQYEITPERVFQNNIKNMSSLINMDCEASVSAVTHNAHNFNEIFGYLRASIRYLTIKYERLALKTEQLERQLEKYNPNHPILKQKQVMEQVDIDLGVVGQKIRNFRPLMVNPVNSFLNRFVQGPVCLPRGKKRSYSKPANQKDVKVELNMVQNFINKHLVKFLVEDPQVQHNLPKKIVLNLYYRWCKAKGHDNTKVQQRVIKSSLTNELKRLFPRLDHTESNYRGIIFKGTLGNQKSSYSSQPKQPSKGLPRDQKGKFVTWDGERRKSDKMTTDKYPVDRMRNGDFKIQDQVPKTENVDSDEVVEWSQQIRRGSAIKLKPVEVQSNDESNDEIEKEVANKLIQGTDNEMIGEDWSALAMGQQTDLENDISIDLSNKNNNFD